MIVIYITDARTQYPPTVPTTLGLPIGAIQPYRYRLKWIQPSLRDRWRANQLVGQPTLICYLEGNSGDLKGARAFCVRTGTVVRSEIEHAYGIVQVELQAFPAVKNLADVTHLANDSNILSSGPPRGAYVLEAKLELPAPTLNPYSAWQETAKDLASSLTFNDASFAYLEGIFPQQVNCRPMPLKDGAIRLDPERAYDVRLHSIVSQRSLLRHEYYITADDTVLRIANTSPLHFRHKYWTFPLVARSGKAVGGASTMLAIRPEASILGTEISQLVTVRPTLVGRLRNLALPSLSAATAATAGVLGESVPLWVKVVRVAGGSIGVAVAARR